MTTNKQPNPYEDRINNIIGATATLYETLIEIVPPKNKDAVATIAACVETLTNSLIVGITEIAAAQTTLANLAIEEANRVKVEREKKADPTRRNFIGKPT